MLYRLWQKRTIACSGNDAAVNGNRDTLRTDGECGRVSVNGSRNALKIEAAAVISALGDENDIMWEQGAGRQAPRVSSLGDGNEIRQVER